MKRYEERIAKFEADKKTPHARLRHDIHWLLHNCVVHPILVLPYRLAFWYARDLHDLSSDWLNNDVSDGGRSPVPKPGSVPWWIFHNVVAHPLIGILPIESTFKLHDWTAKKMNTPGWV